MQNHLNQVSHNKKFHDCLNSNFPTNFYDWKTTVIFYISVHCLRALAASKQPPIVLGDSHTDARSKTHPRNGIMPVSWNAWDSYQTLREHSNAARYNGFTDEATFQALWETNYNFCFQIFSGYKSYINNQLRSKNISV